MSRWTPCHSVLLSQLLESVIGTREQIEMRKDYCRLKDCIRSAFAGYNSHFTGSRAEGLDLPGSDMDYMRDINELYSMEVLEPDQYVSQSQRRHLFAMVTDSIKPAFATLCLVSSVISSPRISDSLQWMNGALFLSSYLIVLEHTTACEHSNLNIQGPSVEHPKKGRHGIETDIVYSIYCSFWPRAAVEWVRRTRLHNWPEISIINKIVDFGFHLVPVGHPHSPKKMMEWRISFSIAERLLVWSFNHLQTQMYAILKLILKQFIKPNCSSDNFVLCSYFIKTYLFWKFEETSNNFWKMKNFRECLKCLLVGFRNVVHRGILRHYFIANFNLLEVKMTQDAKVELVQLFDMAIQYDVKIIEQCRTLKQVWDELSHIINGTGFLPNFKSTYLPVRNVEMNTQCLIREKLSLSFFDLHFIESCNELTVLDALNACTKWSTKTLLGPLIFRFFRLMCIIPQQIDWLQSNKYIYSLIRFFNDASTDIATGKLWTAILFLMREDYNMALLTINKLLSSVPPYALYSSFCRVVSGSEVKCLYEEIFMNAKPDVTKIARRALLSDFIVYKKHIAIVPAAIQMELIYNNPEEPLLLSPFTCAYYLQFLCYHGLRQYDNRDCALRHLVDVTKNSEQRGCECLQYHTYNIAGHCLWVVGKTAHARKMFLKSIANNIHVNHGAKVQNDYNAARHYLRSYMYDIDIELD